MKIYNSNNIAFELSEIEAELEISYRKYTPLKPLETGDLVPHFLWNKGNINAGTFLKSHEKNASVLLRQIAGKPLVIGFYSSKWKNHGLEHLKYLNHLNNEIIAHGSNLLILSPDEPSAKLEEIIWDNSLQLDFYFDKDNEIAKKFGLFGDFDPAWNKYPGIEVNVPLLATYVIDQSNRVAFEHVDHKLQGPEFGNDLLQSIQISHLFNVSKKSA